jgi:hypothetical protein
MLRIERAILLEPAEVLAWAQLGEYGMSHLAGCEGLLIDGAYVEQVRKMRRAADRLLENVATATRAGDQLPAEAMSASSIGLPQAITASEAAEIIGCDVRTIYRIKRQLGVLREERPLMLSKDGVVRFKIIRDAKRSSAA